MMCMSRRICASMLAMLLLLGCATAEVYAGSTVAGSIKTIEAESDGILEQVNICTGQRVSEGDPIASTRLNRVFASGNGIVSAIHVQNGEATEDAVLEIAPENRYIIHSTVSKAYSAAENNLIHFGETLYMRCTVNGTHRAVGIVTDIDADTYMVEAIGGELYIGETVYLYRGDDFESEDRVGIGTVVPAETLSYKIDGTVIEHCVEEGESVERGELLFSWSSGGRTQASAPCSGIITEILAEEGESVIAGQPIAKIASCEDILIEISVREEEIADVSVGDKAFFMLSCEDGDIQRDGVVCDIHAGSSNGVYSVRIRPDQPLEYIGQSAEVTAGE